MTRNEARALRERECPRGMPSASHDFWDYRHVWIDGRVACVDSECFKNDMSLTLKWPPTSSQLAIESGEESSECIPWTEADEVGAVTVHETRKECRFAVHGINGVEWWTMLELRAALKAGKVQCSPDEYRAYIMAMGSK